VQQDPRSTRIELTNEWHARPGLSLPPPFRCTHVVELRPGTGIGGTRDEFSAFCADFGTPGPPDKARYHAVEVGSWSIKWESHTEATSHTIFVPGNGQPPFSETAIDFLDEDKRERLTRNMFVGVQVEVVRPPGEADPYGYELAQSLLGSKVIYGGWMSARTAAVWSAFTLDARGFVRIVIVAQEDNEERISRLLHRLLDLETYRMLAMLALPAARETMAALAVFEPELDEVMERLSRNREGGDHEGLLSRITVLAARVEHLAAANATRFAAARNYERIVERRSSEVDDEVLNDHQRYTNFLSRSLTPAMRTCGEAESRMQDLALRVSRAANLLDTMVDLVKKRQNQEILESLAHSAKLQVNLQQAVEGFSIVAISYYAVGLVAYALKAAKAAGLPVDPSLLTGVTAPVVLAVVWLTIRRVRQQLTGRSADARENDLGR